MTDLHAEAHAMLAEHTTLVLAITDADGPWAAAVYFVADGFRLYWLSSPDARHSRALVGSPRVAGAIHGEQSDWREIRGLQLEGRAAELTDRTERRRVEALYTAKFPFARPLLARITGVRWYRLLPTRLVSVDNRRGFGDRREVPLAEGDSG
jgi:uncharacterized protein YhbP (UPF0306 family)